MLILFITDFLWKEFEMILLKTSGETLPSVIGNQKHASKGQPKDWQPGVVVLLSKNKTDRGKNEKQIQYIASLDTIRLIQPGEIERYWPGNEGRWEYLWSLKQVSKLTKPFDLEEVLGPDAALYRPVVTFAKIRSDHEKKIESFLKRTS